MVAAGRDSDQLGWERLDRKGHLVGEHAQVGIDVVDVAGVVQVVHAEDLTANGLADDLEAAVAVLGIPTLGSAGAGPAVQED
jgi:hypothetical protein